MFRGGGRERERQELNTPRKIGASRGPIRSHVAAINIARSNPSRDLLSTITSFLPLHFPLAPSLIRSLVAYSSKLEILQKVPTTVHVGSQDSIMSYIPLHDLLQHVSIDWPRFSDPRHKLSMVTERVIRIRMNEHSATCISIRPQGVRGRRTSKAHD